MLSLRKRKNLTYLQLRRISFHEFFVKGKYLFPSGGIPKFALGH